MSETKRHRRITAFVLLIVALIVGRSVFVWYQEQRANALESAALSLSIGTPVVELEKLLGRPDHQFVEKGFFTEDGGTFLSPQNAKTFGWGQPEEYDAFVYQRGSVTVTFFSKGNDVERRLFFRRQRTPSWVRRWLSVVGI